MPNPKFSVEDLPPEERKRLGVKLPRHVNFTKEQVRYWSFKVLALIAELTAEQRDRVLKQCLKIHRM